jgi:hypothetical protein
VPWVSVNQFIPVISKESLQDQIVKFLYIQPGISIANEILCENIPIFEFLQYVTCDCISGNSGLQECANINLNSIQLGSQLFCRGSSKTVRIGNSIFTFETNSVPFYLYCINVAIYSYSASNYRSSEVISTSGLLTTLTNRNNRYAVITNQFGFTSKFYFFLFLLLLFFLFL